MILNAIQADFGGLQKVSEEFPKIMQFYIPQDIPKQSFRMVLTEASAALLQDITENNS